MERSGEHLGRFEVGGRGGARGEKMHWFAMEVNFVWDGQGAAMFDQSVRWNSEYLAGHGNDDTHAFSGTGNES